MVGEKKRVPAEAQTRSQKTRREIEAAALQAFSEAGYDATGTRLIADRAGVKQQLIHYHYGSKLKLWKAVADGLFDACRERITRRSEGLKGVDDTTRIQLLVREFLLFSAERPELGRFMMHEGGCPGPRLTWLHERHTRDFFEMTREGSEAVQAKGIAPEGDPVHFVYLLLGATSMFSQAAEVSLRTGQDPRDPEAVQRYVDLVVRLLLPGI